MSLVMTQQAKKAMGAASSMSFDIIWASFKKIDDTALLRTAEGVCN